MIRFFHTADLHFGVENYGKIDPKTGIHSRLWDFKLSFEECIEKAISENIDFFLFCGDAYKTAYPTPTQQKQLVTLFLRLHAAKIPVVVIVGNHDHPLSFGKSNSLDVFEYLPIDGFHVFSKPDIVAIQTKNGPVQIIGIPWPTRNNIIAQQAHHFKNNTEIANYISEKVGQIIFGLASNINPKLPSVLAAHLTVSTGLFSGSEKPAIFGADPLFLPSQLALSQFDYVALGHLHRYQNLNPNGHPSIVYSGSLERVDFGERKETKGFCDVTIQTEGNCKKCTHKFVPVNTRSMLQIEVQLKPNVDQTEQVLTEIKKYNLDGAILKILYHVPEDTTDKIDLYAIHRACFAAWQIVGIFPIHKQVAREKRAVINVGMEFETTIQTYLQTKGLEHAKQEKIINKAMQLYGQLEEPAA